MLSSGVGEGDVMVLGGWSNRAMLSRYGAYAASERAFAAVESRLEALEPWGRSVQSVVPVPARRRAGGVGLYLQRGARARARRRGEA
jgi:hypothetical protein